MTTIYTPAIPSEDYGSVSSEVLTQEIETAREQLAAAIEVKGEDYVYLTDTEANPSEARECLYLRYERIDYEEKEEGIRYIGPKGPSCIVGHVMVGMGIPLQEITPQEGTNAEEALNQTHAFTSLIVREALNKAQQKQDHANGFTWGQAVEEFEAYINQYTRKTDG